MKNRLIPIFISAAACLFQVATHANDIEPGKEFYTAIKAPAPIVLDGDLSEWSGAQVLADPRFSIPKGSGDEGELVFFELYDAGGPGPAVWDGPDDQTSAVQVVYDDENVYFGFIVTDEYHENAANSAWNGDSVQLMIANEARDTQVALYNYALGGTEDELGDVIVMHEAGPGGTDAIVTRNTETKRTTYEIMLPKAALGLDNLAGGVRFGLGMAINDGDEEAPGQQGWGGLGAHAIVFGKSPSETALVTLATSNDIEPGKEFYTANPTPGPIVVDGDLEDWPGIPVLSDPRFSIPKGSGRDGELVLFELYDAGGPGPAVWDGPDDHTSAVQIAYDNDNVYFGFVVTDEYHENAANSAWNGDSIQLMIANNNQDQQVALYNYALGGTEDELGDVIVMHEAGPGGTEAVVTRNTETKRTTYEIQLPTASLGLETIGLGTQFGLGMAINDGDEAAPGQQGWGGLGAHSIVFGKTPGQTALVTLGIGGGSGDLPFLSAINPGLQGFSFRANDKGSATIDPATAVLIIDGETVPLTASPKNLDATDFTYTRSGPFPSGSEHSYSIEIRDTNGNTVTDVNTFTTQTYITIPPGWTVTPDEGTPGFNYRTYQVNSADSGVTIINVSEANDGLAGRLGAPNIADPAEGIIETVVNFDEIGGPGGVFQDLTGLPGEGSLADRPDDLIPGAVAPEDDIAQEFLTFINLPAGLHNMTVNSDDGFRVTVSQGHPSDAFGLTIAEFVGTRGAANTSGIFLVEADGWYTFRLVWFDRSGGASVEWSADRLSDGEPVLINDRGADGHFPSVRSGDGLPWVRAASPTPGANIFADASIAIELVDGAGTVDEGSVSITLDGATLPITSSKSGGVTTANWDNPGLLASGTRTAVLSYQVDGTPTARTWTFDVGAWTALPVDQGTAPGSASTRGINWRMHEAWVDGGANLPTTIERAEDQIAGLPIGGTTYENNASPQSGTTDVVNFDQAGADQGNFPLDNFIPGSIGETNPDDPQNLAGEFTAFVEFPAAGFYRMGVNSDDGFEVSVTESDRDAPVLGQFDGGRGASDTVFGFQVPCPGVWPIRLLWFEGGGGANVEWFTIDADGTRRLLNSTGSLLAYTTRSNTPLEGCEVVVEPPAISIALSDDGGLVITFEGTLTSSAVVEGPYSPEAGANSPLNVTPDQPAAFYRSTR